MKKVIVKKDYQIKTAAERPSSSSDDILSVVNIWTDPPPLPSGVAWVISKFKIYSSEPDSSEPVKVAPTTLEEIEQILKGDGKTTVVSDIFKAMDMETVNHLKGIVDTLQSSGIIQ